MVSSNDVKKGVEFAPMLWYRGAPQFIPNRILNSGVPEEEVYANELNPLVKKRKLKGGVVCIKVGHSAKYLAWKLEKQKKKKKQEQEKSFAEETKGSETGVAA
ncbi:unnamed protein product [Ambrosiozyma monospora]|uniref:Unnamed protein product n=1 Tax=Ambrosiozyma monospora TaxID=43982 RepID=A0A9W6T522_AMBMO|nr:unnamed protein product [Ambrosiozyma monospora]